MAWEKHPDITEDYLIDQYIVKGRTKKEIAADNGVSVPVISGLLTKYGLRKYEAHRHGLSKHPLNYIWSGIKERCNNPNADNYKWYGAKGVRVCNEWLVFLPFYEWAISNGWEPGMSIDRIDNRLGYSPSNCRIVRLHDQFRNRSTNVSLTINRETRLQCDWNRLIGKPRGTIAKWKYRHGTEYAVERIKKELADKCES